MAQFSANPQRFDPYKNFKFRVKWDGKYVAGVSKVSGLKRTTEVVKHREGGDPSSSRKSPGRNEFEAITLERGVTHDVAFEQWANSVWNFGAGLGAEVSLASFRKEIIIELYNEAGQLVIAYKVYRCWVSEFQAMPDLDANANAVAIQHIKLENEGWERDLDVTEPTEPTFTNPPGEPDMRALSAAELIETWERGFGQHPVDRALTLLAACAGAPWESLAAVSIGQRDALLLEMYEHLFGPTLDAFAQCPQCGERLEYSFSTRDLLLPPRGDVEADLSLTAGAWTLRLRLPTSVDLRLASQGADVAAGRTILVQRCVVEARQGGSFVPASALRESIIAHVAAHLAEADPQAEMLINLHCAACRHPWQVVMDIECFLWAKINGLAKRLLREVHALAQAYGWREADILAMSAARRQIYLEMVRS